MNKLEKTIATTIIFLFAYLVLFYDYGIQSGAVYDCTILEYYGNVPEEVKRECEAIKKPIPSNSKIIRA